MIESISAHFVGAQPLSYDDHSHQSNLLEGGLRCASGPESQYGGVSLADVVDLYSELSARIYVSLYFKVLDEVIDLEMYMGR